MHDFTDKTQIAHTFTLVRPLGGICLEKASRDVGLLGGELVDRCVFLSKAVNETRMRRIVTAKDKYLQFSSMYPYSKSIVAKQCVQEGTVF